MKHRKYDTVTIALDADNHAHQICHQNTNCFAAYMWDTISIGNRKRFEMYANGAFDSADGHQIAAIDIKDLKSYFAGTATPAMAKALRLTNLKDTEIKRFIVFRVDRNLSGITRLEILFVDPETIISHPFTGFDPSNKLDKVVENIMWNLGFTSFLFSE